jgi:hypothetical protein
VVVAFDAFFQLFNQGGNSLSMPRFRSIGFMPAATYFMPSRTMACASTVAVVVSPSDVTSLEALPDHLRAHVLQLVLSSISLGHTVFGQRLGR